MRYAILCILLSAVLLACASAPPPIIRKLDPQTSATITYSAVPVLLYRDDPAHAAYARNLVNMAPIEVNLSGRYKYFLWLGIWNTNHAVSDIDARDGFESPILYADGEPLSLEVSGWTPSAIGASEPIYTPPVGSSIDAYYEVSADQLRVIAEARDLTLRTATLETASFKLWGQQATAREQFRLFIVATY